MERRFSADRAHYPRGPVKTNEKRRNPKFTAVIELDDCAEIGEQHRWEVIGSSAQACVHCVQTRPVRRSPW